MLRNYLKTAFRHLLKNKVYSIVNIFGLAIGLTSCLLIGLYLRDELSYDQYHLKKDRIYRVAEQFKTPKKTFTQAVTSPPMGPKIMEDFPEVEQAVRFDPDNAIVQYEDQLFEEGRVVYADANVFEVFSFELIKGNPEKALQAPYTIVITESTAKKYFGEEDPIGKVLQLDNEFNFTVTGLVKDLPKNGHLYFDLLASFASWEEQNPNGKGSWFWNSFYTYVLLKEGTNPLRFEKKLAGFTDRHIGDLQEKRNAKIELFLEPLEDIYLQSKIDWQFYDISGSRNTLYILSAIAFFILFIATINFVNLTTARSTTRVREIGIRKVLGGSRMQLRFQFLGEAFLLSSFAMIFAVILAEFFLPFFNALSSKQLQLNLIESLPILFLLTCVVGFFAGIYPALKFAKFKPITALRNYFKTDKKGIFLRQGLVTFQFAISLILIVSTIVIYKQIKFIMDQNLGFEKDNILVVNFGWDEQVQQRYELIKEELLRHPQVEKAAASLSVPGRINATLGTDVDLGNGESERSTLNAYMIDYDFIDLYGLELVAGRPFAKAFKMDSTAFLLNEAAIRHFGWEKPEDAIGKEIKQNTIKGTIVGVVKDFNYLSLHKNIEPLSFHVLPDWFGLISLKLKPGNIQQTISQLEETWANLVPHRPFNYSLQEDYFNKQYQKETHLSTIVSLFAFIAIFVACLGLFGLTTFSVQRRTKEIGIRKVLGATVGSIVRLFSADFLKLVLIALVIASPIAWYLADSWLEGFAYRTNISWWTFFLAGGLAMIIAFFTISLQSVRAAIGNPTHSLRHE